jgi:hypothetical protein
MRKVPKDIAFTPSVKAIQGIVPNRPEFIAFSLTIPNIRP